MGIAIEGGTSVLDRSNNYVIGDCVTAERLPPPRLSIFIELLKSIETIIKLLCEPRSAPLSLPVECCSRRQFFFLWTKLLFLSNLPGTFHRVVLSKILSSPISQLNLSIQPIYIFLNISQDSLRLKYFFHTNYT